MPAVLDRPKSQSTCESCVEPSPAAWRYVGTIFAYGLKICEAHHDVFLEIDGADSSYERLKD